MAAGKLLNGVSSSGPGATVPCNGAEFAFQCIAEGVGPVAATVTVEASNDGQTWKEWARFTLDGNDLAHDAVALWAPFRFIRGNIESLSGDEAKVTLLASSRSLS
jgi:hypothetical protein